MAGQISRQVEAVRSELEQTAALIADRLAQLPHAVAEIAPSADDPYATELTDPITRDGLATYHNLRGEAFDYTAADLPSQAKRINEVALRAGATCLAPILSNGHVLLACKRAGVDLGPVKWRERLRLPYERAREQVTGDWKETALLRAVHVAIARPAGSLTIYDTRILEEDEGSTEALRIVTLADRPVLATWMRLPYNHPLYETCREAFGDQAKFLKRFLKGEFKNERELQRTLQSVYASSSAEPAVAKLLEQVRLRSLLIKGAASQKRVPLVQELAATRYKIRGIEV